MKDRFAKSIFWLVWSRGVLQAISFVSTIMVIRLLQPSDYGLMALTNVWTSTLTLLSEAGLGAAIVQFRDLSEEELNLCFWVTLILALVGYVGLYITAPMIASWFASPALMQLLRVVGCSLFLVGLRVVPDSLLRKRLQLDKIAQVEILSGMFSIPVVLSMAWAGYGVWALVAAFLGANLIQTATFFRMAMWRPGIRIEKRRLREVLNFSLATLGARICWSLYQQADTVVLGKIAGDATVGLYAMAKEIALLPVSKLASVVNQIAAPTLADLQADATKSREFFLRGLRLVAWVTFPLCIGLLVVADELVKVIFTEKWIAAVPLIQVLCVYASIRSLDVFLPPILMSKYRSRFLFFYTLSLLLVMPISFCAAAWWFGAIGVASVWVAVYPLIMGKMAKEALQEIQIVWKTLWIQLGPPLGATMIMTMLVTFLRWGAASWGNSAPTAFLTMLIMAGAVMYSAAFWQIGGSVKADMQEVAGWILGGGNLQAVRN